MLFECNNLSDEYLDFCQTSRRTQDSESIYGQEILSELYEVEPGDFVSILDAGSEGDTAEVIEIMHRHSFGGPILLGHSPANTRIAGQRISRSTSPDRSDSPMQAAEQLWSLASAMEELQVDDPSVSNVAEEVDRGDGRVHGKLGWLKRIFGTL